MTGGGVSPARGAFIVAVVVVTAGIITALAIRAHRRRVAGEGDLQ